jgi:glutamate synthase (NADPH/NADH) small chain
MDNIIEKGQIAELAEKHQGYTMKEAIDEAKRCLNCKNPLCVQGCPIDHKIPEWIGQLAKGNIGGAMELMNEKSNLPAICGRVCPHEKQCEGHCILNKKNNPVRVGKLERFIADFDSEMGLTKERLKPKTRGKVAVIGSGPAGLTVAGDLARNGFNVVVFEQQKEPGGILLYGIPEYRLPNKIVRREVEKIEALGVLFYNNCLVGTDVTIDSMFKEGFDAVFIGSGTAIPQTLDVKGIDMTGVHQSAPFLRQVSLFASGIIERDEVPVAKGDNVAVVGGGNVAMDTARTALRMGAKSVTVIYRKKEENMPALRHEFLETVEEGVQFMWEAVTEELIGEEINGETVLTKMRISTPEGEKTIPMDKLILAIGSKPANRIISTSMDISVDEKGYILTKDHPYGMTSRKGVFAGGDVVHTPQTVVLAMREAKKVALGIAQYVDAVKLLTE